jgi:hypothetical protein
LKYESRRPAGESDFRFSIFDFRFSIFDFRFSIFDFRFSIFDFRFSIFDFRFRGQITETTVYFMIRTKPKTTPAAEPDAGRPAGSGEEWLGRNRSSKRRLWERLNPLSRKQIRIVAEALALQQTHAQLPEPLRARLSATLQELDRLINRIRALLAEVARRTPPGA